MLNDLLCRVRAASAAFRKPELMKDAKRYRHMRNNAAFRDKNGPGLYWYLPRFLSGGAAEQLDAAIDANLRHNG